jgi:hypothetical protein
MNGLVEHYVHIHVPLDIALARFIQRQIGQKADIPALLDRYQDQNYRYCRVVNEPRNHHDLVLDGMKSVDDLASDVIKWMYEGCLKTPISVRGGFETKCIDRTKLKLTLIVRQRLHFVLLPRRMWHFLSAYGA